MFDAICIRRQALGDIVDPVDIVLFAEALLFYQQTHLIADIQMISHLVRAMGPRLLLELIKDEYLKISYVRKVPAIAHRRGSHGIVFFDPVTMDSTNGEWRLEHLAPEVFARSGTAPGIGRQLGREFATLVSTVDLDTDLVQATKADFSNNQYVQAAVERLLTSLVPEYRLPRDFYFHLTAHVEGGRAGFQLDTNTDFAEANRLYNERLRAEGDTINGPALLVYLFEARCDLHFAAQDNAELATHEAKSVIIGTKFGEILAARANSQLNIEEFQRAVLVNSHEIGESIKLGYRTWSDYLQLLKEARRRRFKDWLGERDANATLVNEYVRVCFES